MDSVRATDNASKAAQKTPKRIELDSMLAKIDSEEYINPEFAPHMTLCLIVIKNGYILVGKSVPADPENFDAELGRKFAKEDCIRQMWPLEAYSLLDNPDD